MSNVQYSFKNKIGSTRDINNNNNNNLMVKKEAPKVVESWNNYSLENFNLKWKNNDKTTDFIFSTKLTDDKNVWTAFAFSEDEKMVNYNFYYS